MSKLYPEASKSLKSQVIENCWQYVHENFHKFNEANKIKISLAILTKDMPTTLNGSGINGETKVVIIYPDGKKIEDTVGNTFKRISSEVPRLPS
jgi:hypothetical protein